VGLIRCVMYNCHDFDASLEMLSLDHLETETEATVDLVWQVFKPDRPGVRLVGRCGDHLAQILVPRAGVREVYVSEWNTCHYCEKHGVELDVQVAETILPGILASPAMICEGDDGELLFLGHYSDRHYLVVPVKALPGELWLCTMFVTNKKRFERRAEKKGMVLYLSEE